jgi:hypothetical protein
VVGTSIVQLAGTPIGRHLSWKKMDEIFDRLQNIELEKDFDWLKV